jgi:DHA2 family multidrug resistance protein-like MFS transporter
MEESTEKNQRNTRRQPHRKIVTPPHPAWLVVGCCAAGVSKFIAPKIWVFYPPEAELFGAGWAQANLLSGLWAVIIVLFLVIGGLIGDKYGRRRMLLIGLIITVSANALLMINESKIVHIILQSAVQIGGALVLPLALATLYIFYHDQKRIFAFGWYVFATSLASIFASTVANFWINRFGWQGAYLTPFIFGVIALIIIYFNLPESYISDKKTPRAMLYAGWTLLLLGFVYALVHFGFVRDWFGPVLIVSSIAAVTGLVLVVWWDIKTPGNLFQGFGQRERDLSMLIVIGVIAQLVYIGFFQPTYNYYSIVKDYRLLFNLLAFLPLGLGMLAAVYLVARKWGGGQVRRLLAANFIICGISIGVMAIRPEIMPYIFQILPLVAFGFGILAIKTVWADAFFQTVIDDFIGLNAGINSATLLIGGALGAMLAGQLMVLNGYEVFHEELSSIFTTDFIQTLFASLEQITSREEALAALNLGSYGPMVWNNYIIAYAYGHSRTLIVFAAISFIIALVIYYGMRRSIRFSAHEVDVDIDASVFEEVDVASDFLE